MLGQRWAVQVQGIDNHQQIIFHEYLHLFQFTVIDSFLWTFNKCLWSSWLHLWGVGSGFGELMLKLMMCLRGEDNRRMLPEHEGDTSDAEVNLDGEQQEVFLSKNNSMAQSPLWNQRTSSQWSLRLQPLATDLKCLGSWTTREIKPESMALTRPLVRWKMGQWLLAIYFYNFFDVSGCNVFTVWTEIDRGLEKVLLDSRLVWEAATKPASFTGVAGERDASPFQTCPAKTDKPPRDLQ